MKKTLISLAVVILLAIAYYLISPLWRTIKVDEALPSPKLFDFTQVTPTISFPSGMPTTASGSSVPATAGAFSGMEKLSTAQIADMEAQSAQMTPIPKSEYQIADMITVLNQGTFVASAHDVAGTAKLIDYPDEKILRFENFQTINGPDLRIYLSPGKDTKGAIDLGPIRATQGNVNYVVKKDLDTTKYTNVLVWCRAFGVLFSYAELR